MRYMWMTVSACVFVCVCVCVCLCGVFVCVGMACVCVWSGILVTVISSYRKDDLSSSGVYMCRISLGGCI